jgi:hypothetical protein
MTCGREASNVKGETSCEKIFLRKASLMRRILFRSFDVSRFTFHEQRGHSQAGR